MHKRMWICKIEIDESSHDDSSVHTSSDNEVEESEDDQVAKVPASVRRPNKDQIPLDSPSTSQAVTPRIIEGKPLENVRSMLHLLIWNNFYFRNKTVNSWSGASICRCLKSTSHFCWKPKSHSGTHHQIGEDSNNTKWYGRWFKRYSLITKYTIWRGSPYWRSIRKMQKGSCIQKSLCIKHSVFLLLKNFNFHFIFQIERIANFGASSLKDLVPRIIREVLSQNLRLTYCPQKAVNGKKSFKDSIICKEIVLRKLCCL